MLKATNIYKSFNNIDVLKDVSIEIKKGKIISIIGKSGAGKSTLLYILSTLDKPSRGDIFFNNKKINNLKGDYLAEFRNKNIGFIFQFHNLLSEFSVLENVCMPALISSSETKKIKEKAIDLLKKLNLSDRMSHKPNELSGGEQQRVAIARSLINSPDIIFADEPTGNLDIENSKNFIKLIQKCNKDFNQTFVIVTHNKDFLKVSDYSFTLNDGRINKN